MGLSSDLISEFVKITNDNKKRPDEKTVFGTVSTDGSQYYVKIDGSDQLTPVSTTSTINDGDRVRLNIRDHTAIVTGNVSDPSVGVKTANGLKSSIDQTAEQIRLEVSDEVNKLNSNITLTANEIRSEVKDEVNGLNSKITQNANGITSVVSKQDEFSQFQQTVEGFSFMGTGGTVKIQSGDINLTGAIKFSDLTDSASVQNQINNANSNASDALDIAESAESTADGVLTTVNGITIKEGSKTYLDGEMLYTNSVYADAMHLGGALTVYKTLYGNTVGGYLGYDSGFNSEAGIGIRDATENHQVVCTEKAARISYLAQNQVVCTSNGVFIDGDDGIFFAAGGDSSTVRIVSGLMYPYPNNAVLLGNSNFKWSDIYCANTTIQTSDRNEKNSIEDLPDKYIALFDKLRPRRFKLNSGTSGRYHIGYIAQEVEDAMIELGIDSLEFAGLVKDQDEDGNDVYMLRYGEFDAIRDLKIKRLENDFLAVKSENEELKARIEKLEKLLTQNT